jgi:NAD(P)-dependent dehydrogenase (short-subunit alcohol dehydrogenase family)
LLRRFADWCTGDDEVKQATLTRAVLVTGASTGLGRKVTEALAAASYCVYAGARRSTDLRALAEIDNVCPLRLDVTSDADIAAAIRSVTERGLGLYGLVNNAGVATVGRVVEGDDAEFELIMTVNVRGTYQITKAFAPLIAASMGRIVTIGSTSGVLAREGFAAYCMSKHALEAFTDALSQEMTAAGVRVSMIEPGRFRTDLVQNTIARIGADPRLPNLDLACEPDAVVAAVLSALFDENPKHRYLVVADASEAQAVVRRHIARLVQLNEGHPHTCERSTLIRILDEELSRSSQPGR